jgi:hypothetical protein
MVTPVVTEEVPFNNPPAPPPPPIPPAPEAPPATIRYSTLETAETAFFPPNNESIIPLITRSHFR